MLFKPGSYLIYTTEEVPTYRAMQEGWNNHYEDVVNRGYLIVGETKDEILEEPIRSVRRAVVTDLYRAE